MTTIATIAMTTRAFRMLETLALLGWSIQVKHLPKAVLPWRVRGRHENHPTIRYEASSLSQALATFERVLMYPLDDGIPYVWSADEDTWVPIGSDDARRAIAEGPTVAAIHPEVQAHAMARKGGK